MQPEAEDIVQEAYAKLLGTQNWREISSPRSYVLAAVRTGAIDRFRRSKVVTLRDFDGIGWSEVADDSPDQHRVASAREELATMMTALDTLPPQCRKVFIERKLHGRPPREIAVKLGISVSTVEKHLAKAIRALTRIVGPLDVASLEGRRNEEWRTPPEKRERT